MICILFYFLSINLAFAQVGPVGPSTPPPVSDTDSSDVEAPSKPTPPKPNIDLPYKPANNLPENTADFTPMTTKKAEPVKEIVIPYISSKSPQSFGAGDPQ